MKKKLSTVAVFFLALPGAVMANGNEAEIIQPEDGVNNQAAIEQIESTKNSRGEISQDGAFNFSTIIQDGDTDDVLASVAQDGTGSSLAQENTAKIEQTDAKTSDSWGERTLAGIIQTGESSYAYISQESVIDSYAGVVQYGSYGFVDISQEDGSGYVALVYQYGVNNSAEIHQEDSQSSGDFTSLDINFVGLFQDGSSLDIDVSQDNSSRSLVEVFQFGYGHNAYVVQKSSEDSYVLIRQGFISSSNEFSQLGYLTEISDSNENYVYVKQYESSGVDAYISQVGSGDHELHIEQEYSTDSSVEVFQDGEEQEAQVEQKVQDGSNAYVGQWGNGNDSSIYQGRIGYEGGNSASIRQYGERLYAKIDQERSGSGEASVLEFGTDNEADILQIGNGNYADVIIGSEGYSVEKSDVDIYQENGQVVTLAEITEGSGHIIDIRQTGSGDPNMANVQVGGAEDNLALITQDGLGNSSIMEVYGSNNTAVINQVADISLLRNAADI